MSDILVIDSLNRRIFWNELSANCTVQFAETAEKGLRMLSEDVDLVFISCDLPAVDSMRFLGKIKEVSPTVSVILIASSSDGEESAGDFVHDRNISIQKPLQAEEILGQIRKILHLRESGMSRISEPAEGKTAYKESYPGIPPHIVEGVLKVRDFIHNNCAESLSLSDACRMAGVSKTYFCRYFKSITGYSLRNYHHVVKVKMAEKLLRDKKLTLKAIAKRLGYGDPNYFSTVFRKITGGSPRHRQMRGQSGLDRNIVPEKQ